MKMLRAYQVYTAMKLHFEKPTYSIITSGGYVKVSEGALMKRPRMQYQLSKVFTKYGDTGFIEYLLANHLMGDKYGGVFNISEGHNTYMAWKKRKESLSYTFKQELSVLLEKSPKIEDLWDCTSGHPILLKAHFAKTCSLETLVILEKLYRFIIQVDEHLARDPVWDSVKLKIQKYSPFVKFEKEKFQQMVEQAL